jgi:hypothetical protein
LISERIIRGKASGVVFSYIPEILSSQGVRVVRREQRSRGDRFTGLVEGRKERDPDLFVKIEVEGWEESWAHVGGGFVPRMHVSRMRVETFEVAGEGSRDSEKSIRLLEELNGRLNRYLWHTAG